MLGFKSVMFLFLQTIVKNALGPQLRALFHTWLQSTNEAFKGKVVHLHLINIADVHFAFSLIKYRSCSNDQKINLLK